MNAAWTHLVAAHLVVVLVPLAALLSLVARWVASRPMERTASVLLVLAALLAAVAYFSGPGALEIIDPGGSHLSDLAESHALAGRVAFSVVVLTGALALVGLLQEVQGEQPSAVLGWGVILAAVVAGGILVWAAHLGGVIRHPEIRSPTAILSESL